MSLIRTFEFSRAHKTAEILFTKKAIRNRSRNLLSCSPSPPRIKNPFFCKMGNVQGQHGDPTRKHSEAGHGLVFNGDKHQREMSPFDPVSHLTFYELWNVILGVPTSFSKKPQNFKKSEKICESLFTF